MIKLSIIIVSFNTKDLTIGCLHSIEKEAKDISFEVIVIDNNSADGSIIALKEIKKEDYWNKRLVLIFNKSNTGYAKANNQGIKKSKGEYFLLLNSDTVVHKDSLQNLLSFADKTPDAGVIGSKLLNIDGTLQSSCFHFPTITNAIKEYWFGQKGLFDKYAPSEKKPTTVDAVVGAVFLITPEAKKKVGILDERYWAYFEDIDYCRQTWRKGLKVYYLPTSIITHYHGASFAKVAPEPQRWKKLIPSSKIYHGVIKHYLLFIILWLGQKWEKLFQK